MDLDSVCWGRSSSGPVTRLLPIPHGKQRTLLAALLAHAGEVIPADELAELLWEGSPPLSARVTLQNYVKRLRQALGPAGQARLRDPPPGIPHRGQRRRGRPAPLRRPVRGGARGGPAGRLGRGPRPSCGRRCRSGGASRSAGCPPGCWRCTEGPRLEEMRIDALETRIDAEMHLGGHGAGHRRAAPAGRRRAAPGTAPRPADARPVPGRAARRGARRVPGRAPDPCPGTGPGARPPAAPAAPADPVRRSRPGPRRGRAGPGCPAAAGDLPERPLPDRPRRAPRWSRGSCRPPWRTSPGGRPSWTR